MTGKCLIVGEGPHERFGAMENIVKQVCPSCTEFDSDRVANNEIHTHHGRGAGMMKRAIRWIIEADKRGYDALVLLVDQDNYPDRLSEIEDAQIWEGNLFPRALGVPIRTFDSWMLADINAVRKVASVTVNEVKELDRVNKGKEVARAITESLDVALADFYADVARELDVEVVAGKCGRGFSPFLDRLRNLENNMAGAVPQQT